MSEDKKKLEVVFAPGCFDSFDGTQEELDSLIAEIHRMVDSGEFMKNSFPVDLDEISDEELEKFSNAMDAIEDHGKSTRVLN